MFKKNLSLIFITTTFLSFDNQTKAMQKSDDASTSEKTKLQRYTFHCKQEPCNTLKFLAASRCLETLKINGINIYALDSNADHKIILETIPLELIEFCKQCPIFHLIHKQLRVLEQFKAYKYLKITDENLCTYNKLWLELSTKNDIQDINIEGILSAINKDFQSTIEYFKQYSNSLYDVFMTLEDINVVLKLLINPTKKYADLSEQEKMCLNEILSFIGRENNDLLQLLAINRQLPHLNCSISISPFPDYTRSYTLALLVTNGINVNLFKSIIDEEENNYDWNEVLLLSNYDRDAILHNAARSKDFLEVIIRLIEKHISDPKYKQYLMNSKNNNGITPLMVAAYSGNAESVKLLLDNGADADIRSYIFDDKFNWTGSYNYGCTALDFAKEFKIKLMSDGDNIDNEKLEKVNRCIELLTPKRTCILQ